ncbi:hypothetical protein Tco_1581011 [Tanacetum coccineum]
MCSIEYLGKLASKSFALSRPASNASIKPAPEPSELEAPSVNNFYAFSGSGSFLLASSSIISLYPIEGVSARKSADIFTVGSASRSSFILRKASSAFVVH